MRLRDESASAYGSVFILRGLRPEVLERVPAAFEELVAAPDARIARRRWKDDPGRGARLSRPEARRAAARNVHRADADLSDSDLFGLHHRLGYDLLPLNVVLAGDRLSIKTWHAELDGAGSLEVIHGLVDRAAGLPAVPFEKPVAFPLLRGAIRSVAPLAIREALAFRRSNPSPTMEAPLPTTAQQERRGVELRSTRLDPPLVERIRAAGDDDTSVNARMVALVAETVAAVYRGDGDPAVGMPVHLGRWAGGRVEGNFVVNLRLGGLRSTTWSPRLIQSLIARMQQREGFGGYLWDLQWPLKARIRRRSPEEAAQPELGVDISAIRSPRPFPAEAWTTGAPQMTFASIGPYPACYTLLWRVGGTLLLSFEDETGRFDADAYLPELERRIAAFVGAPDEAVLTADVPTD